MARQTISISEELQERARESGLNISAVCQDALERELAVREEYGPGLIVMQLRALARRIEESAVVSHD